MVYKHRQIGYLMISIAVFLLAYFTVIFYLTEFDLVVLIVCIAVLALLGSFSSLTVSVDQEYVRLKFGPGIFSRKFPLQGIKSVRAVRNKWYYGWGIRWWPWKNLLIFNVSGLDAVELEMVNGKLYRIGTDEPKKLELAIREKLKWLKQK